MDEETQNYKGPAVMIKDFNFTYNSPYGGSTLALKNINLRLEQGERCLLIGANGAGKSTLLRVLAGKHLHDKEQVLVMGKPAFYQTLGLSGISYLGNNWTRTVAFAGNNIPYQADIPVKDMMSDLQNEHPARRDRLYEMLEIDPDWRMHEVSDGQRRGVQIMLGLLRPFKLLLIDEMTVDLDVLARKSFLKYLELECKENGATIVYATHIFDGMEGWPTQLVYLDSGDMMDQQNYQQLQANPEHVSLFHNVVDFLTEMHERRRKMRLEAEQRKSEKDKENEALEKKSNMKNFSKMAGGFTSGRMMSYFQG